MLVHFHACIADAVIRRVFCQALLFASRSAYISQNAPHDGRAARKLKALPQDVARLLLLPLCDLPPTLQDVNKGRQFALAPVC